MFLSIFTVKHSSDVTDWRASRQAFTIYDENPLPLTPNLKMHEIRWCDCTIPPSADLNFLKGKFADTEISSKS